MSKIRIQQKLEFCRKFEFFEIMIIHLNLIMKFLLKI